MQDNARHNLSLLAYSFRMMCNALHMYPLYNAIVTETLRFILSEALNRCSACPARRPALRYSCLNIISPPGGTDIASNYLL